MKHKPIFVTGIGTGVGKTIASAVIVESLRADYWKPIQSGDLDHTDTDRVKSLISNKDSIFHAEAYRFNQPYSPHKSAALDNNIIDLNNIELPRTNNCLVIEGAGGLMVPLNDRDLMIDLIKKFDAEVVLVSQNYLGSINHTLMSAEILHHRGIKVRNIVFCGEPDLSTQDIISKHFQIEHLHIPFIHSLTRKQISKLALEFKLSK